MLINLVKPLSQHVKEVEQWLAKLQLKDKLFEPVAKLSGGQRQRTAVARSLYQGGELLLADEPVSSIDEHQSHLVLSTLCDNFSTIVLAMHDIQLSLQYCDRIIGIENGQIVLDRLSKDLAPSDLLPLYRGEID